MRCYIRWPKIVKVAFTRCMWTLTPCPLPVLVLQYGQFPRLLRRLRDWQMRMILQRKFVPYAKAVL